MAVQGGSREGKTRTTGKKIAHRGSAWGATSRGLDRGVGFGHRDPRGKKAGYEFGSSPQQWKFEDICQRTISATTGASATRVLR